MWCAERSRPVERPSRQQVSKQASELRHLEGLAQVQGRQDPGEAASQHRLARARRAAQQEVMPAGGGDLDRATRLLLAVDFREVVLEDFGGRLMGCVDEGSGRDLLLAQQVRDELGQVGAGDHLEAFDQGRLVRVRDRNEDPLEPGSFQAAGRDQHPVHVSYGAVERELAQERAAGRRVAADFCERDRDGDREVEAAAVLAHLRGSQVDGQALAGKVQAAVLDGGANALAGLLDGGGSETDMRRQPRLLRGLWAFKSSSKHGSPHPASSLRELADLPTRWGGEMAPCTVGEESYPPTLLQDRRGSGRQRPSSSRYPAGWSGSWLNTSSHRCRCASSKSRAFSSSTRSGSRSADIVHGTRRWGVWHTRSPVTAHASSPERSTMTWLPGVCPPTCRTWTPGSTSASPFKNSTRWFPSSRGVKSSVTYPDWLRASGCKAKSHSLRWMKWRAFGKVSSRQPPSSRVSPPAWSQCRCVVITASTSSGRMPTRFSECNSPSGSRKATCRARFSLSLVPMPVSQTITRPFTRAIRPTHAQSIMLLPSAGFCFSHRTLGTTPNISPPSAFHRPAMRMYSSRSPSLMAH